MTSKQGRIAVFGGVYNNHLALEATLADARRRGVDAIYCLGDIGGFGPSPDRAFPLLREGGVIVVQGNYDDSVGNARDDCACGYTDPRDNEFAQISFDYTLRNTSAANRAWLRALPASLRIRLGEHRLLLCHGSPRRVNEFLWESTTPRPFIERLLDEQEADAILVTHTGLHWHREVSGSRHLVNVGAIGRPANDGRTEVWYALLEAGPGGLRVEFIPVAYDHEALALEMEAEGLPAEFVETIRTGWWTTCLEILPAKERIRGRH